MIWKGRVGASLLGNDAPRSGEPEVGASKFTHDHTTPGLTRSQPRTRNYRRSRERSLSAAPSALGLDGLAVLLDDVADDVQGAVQADRGEVALQDLGRDAGELQRGERGVEAAQDVGLVLHVDVADLVDHVDDLALLQRLEQVGVVLVAELLDLLELELLLGHGPGEVLDVLAVQRLADVGVGHGLDAVLQRVGGGGGDHHVGVALQLVGGVGDLLLVVDVLDGDQAEADEGGREGDAGEALDSGLLGVHGNSWNMPLDEAQSAAIDRL